MTGKSEQWQQNTSRLLRYGSLHANLAYNIEYELLRESRKESDKALLEKIRKYFLNEN